MINLNFSFQLNLSRHRTKGVAPTDWIDEESAKNQAQSQARQHFWEVFPAMAERLWEHLTARLTQDAGRLSKVFPAEIKEAMLVNGRERVPQRNQLFIDNQAYPAIYLDIQLDSPGRSIRINELRRESLESKGWESHQRLLLELDSNDEIVIKDIEGEILSVDEVSKFILERFLRK